VHIMKTIMVGSNIFHLAVCNFENSASILKIYVQICPK
jgi:hypothetical protein